MHDYTLCLELQPVNSTHLTSLNFKIKLFVDLVILQHLMIKVKQQPYKTKVVNVIESKQMF